MLRIVRRTGGWDSLCEPLWRCVRLARRHRRAPGHGDHWLRGSGAPSDIWVAHGVNARSNPGQMRSLTGWWRIEKARPYLIAKARTPPQGTARQDNTHSRLAGILRPIRDSNPCRRRERVEGTSSFAGIFVRRERRGQILVKEYVAASSHRFWRNHARAADGVHGWWRKAWFIDPVGRGCRWGSGSRLSAVRTGAL